MTLIEQFSRNRLNGETVPADLGFLLTHAAEFEQRTGIRIPTERDWAPWLDTSYLTAEELKNPGISSNIKAIAEICSHIAFVAEHEDRQYLGYWRGPSSRPISESPLVWFDNEGQFDLCPGSTFAEAVLVLHNDFKSLRAWLKDIGVHVAAETIEQMSDTKDEADPRKMHWHLQEKYLGQL